jgi:molecular chaperone GrpE (heat shock protein)
MIGSTVSIRRVAESLEIIKALQKADPENVNKYSAEKKLTELLPVDDCLQEIICRLSLQ